MTGFPNRLIVEQLRRQYPVGCRVILCKMDDPQAPPAGTKGTVRYIDDIGSLGIAWDNGCGLSAAYDEDEVRRCLTEKEKSQILALKESGHTDMYDLKAAFQGAFEMDLMELLVLIGERPKDYLYYLLFGEAEERQSINIREENI